MPIALLLEVPDFTVAKNAALEEVVWEGPTKILVTQVSSPQGPGRHGSVVQSHDLIIGGLNFGSESSIPLSCWIIWIEIIVVINFAALFNSP